MTAGPTLLLRRTPAGQETFTSRSSLIHVVIFYISSVHNFSLICEVHVMYGLNVHPKLPDAQDGAITDRFRHFLSGIVSDH